MARRTLTLALVFAAAALGACGGRPFVDDLAELDGLLASNRVDDIDIDTSGIEDTNVRELRQQARDSLANSRLNYEHAADAWQNRKDDQADEFTRVGLIYFHAADNYATSADARERLGEANALYQAQRQRRNEYNDAIRSENELIALLETISQLFERNEALQRQLATVEAQFQTEAQAVYSIQEARIAQREAEGTKAPQYAADLYTQANASLARANQLYESGDYEGTAEIALRAIEEYHRATEAARPSFVAEQDVVLRDGQNQQIFQAATRAFGDQLAFIDARGIVVVIPGLFVRGQTDVNSDRVHLLDLVLDLIRQYDNRQILIEGHTQDRGADDANMALSQTRANAVQDYFLDRGVRGSRISTAGFGEAAPRFDNRTDGGRADNDRVEVVFLVR
ncbi:MAG: OmpA family protein [Myxococcales bacterium]|nr:OmpA family protein [Myxococcales bacterium]MCB9520992.1 OmpA family protein [Myxococcales bacterium]MCB9531681.1 OmpA family protein [Myxococcales bacterium]MCB9534016.1 OmpA family protein [Myxococcales bacterium]